MNNRRLSGQVTRRLAANLAAVGLGAVLSGALLAELWLRLRGH